MKRGTVLFFTIVSLALIYPGYGFQKQRESRPQEKHEVGVRLISIDIIVTKDGKFVKDLKRDDFELYEDGKKVPINSFELISFEERPVEASGEFEEKKVHSTPKKKLAVLFDGINTWERNLKKGVEEIVEELTSLIKLGNEVMIFQLDREGGIEILQDFTIEEELIKNAVSKALGSVWKAGEGFEPFPKEWEYFTSAKDPYLNSQVEAYLFKAKRNFERTLNGILTCLNMLKSLPGRKSILFISSGIPDISSSRMHPAPVLSDEGGLKSINPREIWAGVDILDPFNVLGKKRFKDGEKALRKIIQFANAHYISVYSLVPGTLTKSLFSGTTTERVDAGQMDTFNFLRDERLTSLQNLRQLSEGTSAESLVGADTYSKFQQLMKTDLNYYYNISFYPQRKKADNEFHEIEVKVVPKGVDVRFRKGYTDYSEIEATRMHLISAYYNPALFKELPFEAEFVPFYSDSGKYEPWMSIALPTKEFFLDRFIDYARKTFNLHVWLKDKEKGERAFGVKINFPFDITPPFMDHMKTIDYFCLDFKGPKFDFKPREYQAIFALYDIQTNEIGTFELSCSLTDIEKNKESAFINCVLGSLSSNPNQGKKTFSLSQKDGSLVYGEIKFFLKVPKQFKQQEDAYVFMQIYVPQGKAEIQPEFNFTTKDNSSYSTAGELVAESWNKKSKVWSGIFKLDLNSVNVGDNILKVEIPVSGKDFAIVKEMKLKKLSLN